jgi:hypothetical protein
MRPLSQPARLWITGAVSLLVGILAGGGGLYLALRPTLRTFLEASPFLLAAGEGRMDALRLERLNAGDLQFVAGSLESDLDNRLRMLSGYEDVVPADRRDEWIYDSIRRMTAYRQAHPKPPTPGPGGPLADAWTRRAMSLATHHTSARPNS